MSTENNKLGSVISLMNELDGETIQYILEQIGMDEQIHNQLKVKNMINRIDNIEEITKDITYVTAKIFEMKMFKGNVDENFDKVYKIANNFVSNPPKGFAWGLGLDDEFIANFVFKNTKL